MIFSQELMLSDDQAITGDAASTHTIDFGANGTPVGGNAIPQDIGNGTPIALLVQVTEDFDNLTTLDISIETDSVNPMSSPKKVVTSSIALADLVAGSKLPIIALPNGVSERYMRLDYNVVGTNPTAGKLTAGIVSAVQTA